MTAKNGDAIPFSVEISRMIELLASQIYPSPYALLRENVQNAFDAIMLRKHLSPEFVPIITVVIEASCITVCDNGIGMSRQDLREHFWRAGSSSKNNDEARAAGVVGTFGIGAMANFGMAETLEVTSESLRSSERTKCVANRSTLSVTEDCISFSSEATTGEPGTTVKATMQEGHFIDVQQAITYLSEFVCFVDIPVTVNGTLVSQRPFSEAVPTIPTSWQWEGTEVALTPAVVADVLLLGSGTGEVRVQLSNIKLSGKPISGSMILRQGHNAVRTFRNRFGLATASIPSVYQWGGVADFLILKPTAGREALTTESLEFLSLFGGPLDALVSEKLASHPEANNSQAFVNWVSSHRRWDLCGLLRARIEPGDSDNLRALADRSQIRPMLVYSGSDAATLRHASEDKPLVILARNHHRRLCEESFLSQYGKIEVLTDEPKVLEAFDVAKMTLAQSALVFRLTEVLDSDYFLSVEISFGKISHNLPILVVAKNPIGIVLDPDASNIGVMLQIYEKEYGAFGHVVKDFVRTVIFPRVSQYVPSATRQGTESFLKALQRTRDIFEYERSDLESLTSLWTDYLDGKITMEQASLKVASARRSYQLLESSSTGKVRDVVPGVSEGESLINEPSNGEQSFLAAPPITRLEISTDRKVLVIENTDPPLKGFRCFLAISKRVREERGEFFLQPHRTSIVWGGQKALFIFEHHSGEVGLYYDIQMNQPLASASGGGSFETCTIVMKNQIFIPVPVVLEEVFLPKQGETKRLDVRCDLLYIDAKR